ncbi:MAG: hypothetical protein CVU21_06645 [Betaproteobacteria bacterium HGW-Betaproteobacteria-15]|nr:MAG: hypothetical protein CVU21_06645 [Betaproteobacteria bacterium HGW-Betaproteobacteria-15]
MRDFGIRHLPVTIAIKDMHAALVEAVCAALCIERAHDRQVILNLHTHLDVDLGQPQHLLGVAVNLAEPDQVVLVGKRRQPHHGPHRQVQE